MKNHFFFLLFLFLLLVSLCLPAQASFRLQGGSTTQINLNAGTFLVLDSTDTFLENTVSGIGTVRLTGSLDVAFSTAKQAISNLEIAKAPETFVVLQDTSGVSERVAFLNTRNFLVTGPYLFSVGAQAQVQGYGSDAYFITDAPVGGLLKVAVEEIPFEFPVGFDPQTYNPVLLSEEESQTDFLVRCLPNVLAAGGSGSALTNEVVDASWEISPSGNPNPFFNILSAAWAGTDELPGFDRNRCGVARYVPGSGWDLLVADIAPAFGSDPFGRERVGLVEGGFFAVGGKPLAAETSAEVDVLLAGNYAGGGLMSDGLRASGLIPTTEPYTSLGFNTVGFGAGAPLNPAVFGLAGPDAIVDWVFVEVRDGNNPATVVATQAALLQRDGDIVDTDGISPLRLAGIPPGDYHLALHHRNHLAIRTAAPLSFTSDGVEYSFLVDPDQALGGENAVQDLGDGFFALVPGDIDQNGQIQNTDATTLSQNLGSPGYRSADTDLNGQVQNIDLQLKLTPGLGRGRQF